MILPINRLVLEGKNREKLIEARGERREAGGNIQTLSRHHLLPDLMDPISRLSSIAFCLMPAAQFFSLYPGIGG
jgi:hypothetical protein